MTTRPSEGTPTAVVIPAFDEAPSIGHIVRQCRSLAVDLAVFVVDDGSSDGTAALARDAGATVLRNTVRRGKGASLRRGMQAALGCGARRIVTLDADGQHRTSDIPRLVAASLASPSSIVIGVRQRAERGAPRIRVLANRAGDFWISLAARSRIDDSQSGFRVYPATLARWIVAGSKWHPGFTFESEILIEAAWLGFPTAGVDVPRLYGGADARPSYFRPVRDTVSIAVMVVGRLLRRLVGISGLMHSPRHSLRSDP